MGLSAVTIEQFPGLDLRSDPGDARAAIDLQNVTLEPGRVRSRDGITMFHDVASSSTVQFLKGFNRPDPHLIIGTLHASSTSLRAVNSAGTLVGSAVTGLPVIGAEGMTSQAIGTASGSFIYVSGVNVAGFAITRWSGTAWTTPGAPVPATCQVLALSPTDNRLVVCQNSSLGCKVQFSNPGAPEAWSGNDFVLLTPGDGEEIQGAAVYNNQLFIFKQTKFFVFYGNSIDATGSPIFNYRAVDTGVGMHLPAPQSVCAGPDGIYFIANDGIYRTTGSVPVKISAALDPYFASTTNTFWQVGGWPQTSLLGRLEWLDGRLHASLGGDLFVYDTQLNAWTYWIVSNSTISALGSFVKSTTSATVRGVAGVARDTRGLVLGIDGAAFRQLEGLTDDNGVSITSRYRLPFESYGSPGQKRIRETIVEGSGSPTVKWSRDWGLLTPGTTVALGVAPAIDEARQRLAMRGRTFSLQLGVTGSAWSVNRVQVNVSDRVRKPEVT